MVTHWTIKLKYLKNIKHLLKQGHVLLKKSFKTSNFLQGYYETYNILKLQQIKKLFHFIFYQHSFASLLSDRFSRIQTNGSRSTKPSTHFGAKNVFAFVLFIL